MIDIVSKLTRVEDNVDELNAASAGLISAVTQISGSAANLNLTARFTAPVFLPAIAGSISFEAGTGDGASYTAYNTMLKFTKGLAFVSNTGKVGGFINVETGVLDMKGGLRINGEDVLTSTILDPSKFALKAEGVFTSSISAPTATISGMLNAENVTIPGTYRGQGLVLSGSLAGDTANFTGSLGAASVTSRGAVSSASLTATGALSVASATITGSASAASLTVSGSVTATSATLSGNLYADRFSVGNVGGVNGGVNILPGSANRGGLIEFTRPGGNVFARHGYIGPTDSSGVIYFVNETAGAYVNFVNTNGGTIPRVNGNEIWHAGNLDPSIFYTGDIDLASLPGDLNGNRHNINNIGAVNFLNGSGVTAIGVEPNVNAFTIRTGPTNALVSYRFSETGLLTVPSLTVATVATFASTTTTTATATTLNVSLATIGTGTVGSLVVGSRTGTPPGGLVLNAGSTTLSGSLEFTKPGNISDRYGFIGAVPTSGVITLSATTSGGYFNFVTANGAVDPKVNGNTIWHSGNFTPSSQTGYIIKNQTTGQYSLDNTLNVSDDVNARTLKSLDVTATGTITGRYLRSPDLYIDGSGIIKTFGADTAYAKYSFATDGELSVTGLGNTDPMIRITRANTATRRIKVNSLGELAFGGETADSTTHAFRLNGSIWCSQIGDLQDALNAKEPKLTHRPVLAQGGINQDGKDSHQIIIGYSPNGLRATVDGTDIGKFYTDVNLSNPTQDIRLVRAGQLGVSDSRANAEGWDPYYGGVVTGFGNDYTDRVTRLTWRYLQRQDQYGNYYSVGYP